MEKWELIAKYLANECSDQEKESLESWIKADTAHQQTFEKLSKIWQKSSTITTEVEPDVDAAWRKVRPQLHLEASQKPQATVRQLRPRSRYPLYGIAAALLLLISFIGVFLILPEGSIEVSALDQDTTLIQLSDGSKVWLRRNATFKYPRHFGKASREVNLVGEAFFEVRPDASRPFVITSHEASTKVLGTSFNVKALSSSPEVEVQVLTGKVALYDAQDEKNQVILTPGNVGTLNRENLEIRKNETSDVNKLAWKTGKLEFHQSPLSEVVPILSQYYQTEIRLADPGLGNCQIDVVFENLELKEVIKIIQITLKGIYFEVNPEGYTIRGEACTPIE